MEIPLTATQKISAEALLQQHLLILGATGTGKSTTAVSILHGLMMQNQTTIIIDPTGEYTTLPHAVVARLGYNAFIDYEALTGSEIAQLFGASDAETQEKITAAWQSLKIQANVKQQAGIYRKQDVPWSTYEQDVARLYQYPQPADMTLLAEQLQQEYMIPVDDFSLIGQALDTHSLQQQLPLLRRIKHLTQDVNFQQLFNLPQRPEQPDLNMRTDVMYLMRLFASQRSDHKTLVIDVSRLADQPSLGQTVISLLFTALLRIKQDSSQQQPVTLLLDEAHRYLPMQPLAHNGIFQVAREGRKVGVYLMLTTQSPLDMPASILGQFGNYLIHRLNTLAELEQLPALTSWGETISQQGVGQATLVGQQFRPAQTLQIQVQPMMQHRTASPSFF